VTLFQDAKLLFGPRLHSGRPLLGLASFPRSSGRFRFTLGVLFSQIGNNLLDAHSWRLPRAPVPFLELTPTKFVHQPAVDVPERAVLVLGLVEDAPGYVHRVLVVSLDDSSAGADANQLDGCHLRTSRKVFRWHPTSLFRGTMPRQGWLEDFF
jgi:hypothetical protein